MTRTRRTASKRCVIAAAGLAIGAFVLLRRSAQAVRATAAERTRRLPGDDLIEDPLATFTNAVTVRAAPHDVWSWLAQMGAGRAGWYSYDALDNGGHASATEVDPELQHLDVGMVFPAGPGVTDGFTLASFEPERFLVLEWKTPEGARLVSWAFVLAPLNGATRLIVRARGGRGYQFFGLPRAVTRPIVPVVHAVHFIMQRKQLLGIAARAKTQTAG
jgi:hypothetical protein